MPPSELAAMLDYSVMISSKTDRDLEEAASKPAATGCMSLPKAYLAPRAKELLEGSTVMLGVRWVPQGRAGHRRPSLRGGAGPRAQCGRRAGHGVHRAGRSSETSPCGARHRRSWRSPPAKPPGVAISKPLPLGTTEVTAARIAESAGAAW